MSLWSLWHCKAAENRYGMHAKREEGTFGGVATA